MVVALGDFEWIWRFAFISIILKRVGLKYLWTNSVLEFDINILPLAWSLAMPSAWSLAMPPTSIHSPPHNVNNLIWSFKVNPSLAYPTKDVSNSGTYGGST